MTTEILQEYVRTHTRSEALHQEAKSLFAANGATHVVRILDPFRPYITRAKGSRKWDVDGNEYIDYVMGHSGLILGHSHPDVVRAVQQQVAKGVHYGENHEIELEWAKLIRDMIPSIVKIEFCACGQESNLLGVRLARIFTGRKKILRFEENFHGWVDQLAPAGALGALTEQVTIIPGHDLNRLEEELATKEYAILMTEAGGAHMGGQVPWDADFIRALPKLASKYGTIWLMDEVVTGFREAPGGWQSIVGVRPDLTTLGKCVTGGITGGAIGGRADLFEALRPKAPPQGFLRHSGTWNANPLTAAAGVAACKLYKGGEVQRRVNQIAAYFREKGNKAMEKAGVSGRLYGRSIVHLYIGPIDYEPSEDTMPPTRDVSKLIAETITKMQLCLHLLHRSVAIESGKGFFSLSVAHTEEDINQTVTALIDALRKGGESR